MSKVLYTDSLEEATRAAQSNVRLPQFPTNPSKIGDFQEYGSNGEHPDNQTHVGFLILKTENEDNDIYLKTEHNLINDYPENAFTFNNTSKYLVTDRKPKEAKNKDIEAQINLRAL